MNASLVKVLFRRNDQNYFTYILKYCSEYLVTYLSFRINSLIILLTVNLLFIVNKLMTFSHMLSKLFYKYFCFWCHLCCHSLRLPQSFPIKFLLKIILAIMGKTKYQEQWQKGFSWLQKVKTDCYSAFCKKCLRRFRIYSSGICQVCSHAKCHKNDSIFRMAVYNNIWIFFHM